MSKRLSIHHFTGLSCLAFALLSTSCAVSSGPVTRQRPERKLYKWHDEGGPGKVTIRISLTDQIAEFKRGNQEIGWCYVATGKEGHGTRPGSYKITEKIEDKYSNIYGWFEDEFGNVTDNDAKASERVPEGMTYVPAPMPYWMRLTSYGVGMHGGVIPEPGQPASHGCIRMPKDFVPVLFGSVNVGTPVTITNEPSNQGPYQEPHAPMDTMPRHPDGPMPPAERNWTTNPTGPQSADSVTYRNGVPVFVR
ncbi:MAG: L,D-transpeptidase family protein [Verrucomicrobiota bacterium]